MNYYADSDIASLQKFAYTFRLLYMTHHDVTFEWTRLDESKNVKNVTPSLKSHVNRI